MLIEAMACGTPVLAFDKGSAREIIEDGVTGRLVNSVEEAIAAMPALLQLDRRLIRHTFERRFTSRRMAMDYERLYRAICLREAGGRSPAALMEAPLAK